MFKNFQIKDFAMGLITYFIVSMTLDLFGVNRGIVRFIIFVFILLAAYFAIPLYKKNRS